MLTNYHKALANLDMEYARKMMPDATNDEVRLIVMHKIRYELIAISSELRHASAEWLRKYEYKRINGEDLLPEYELPQENER